MSLSRRDFLRVSVGTGAGALIGAAGYRARAAERAPERIASDVRNGMPVQEAERRARVAGYVEPAFGGTFGGLVGWLFGKAANRLANDGDRNGEISRSQDPGFIDFTR